MTFWKRIFSPIVAPVGLDDDFNTYNINADDAALRHCQGGRSG